MSALLDVRVAAAQLITPVIREIRLQPLAGSLPGFSAGSHVQVQLPNGMRNAYSLLGDPFDSAQYRIAVRLQDNSRGGSRYLHEQLQVGDHLRISPPANLFPLQGQARLHILIAGGIGITPLLAYCAELLRRGAQFELHYAFRAGLSDAYVDSLRELIGARLHQSDDERLEAETQDRQYARLHQHDHSVEQHSQKVGAVRENIGRGDEIEQQVVQRSGERGRQDHPPISHDREHREERKEHHV